MSSPEYVASAVSGKARRCRAEVILHVATPPDIGTVSVRGRRTGPGQGPRWRRHGPVGVAVLAASPITFARSVGVVESARVTAETLVLESDADADAAGNEPHTTGTSAEVRPAASTGMMERKISRLTTGRHGVGGIPLRRATHRSSGSPAPLHDWFTCSSRKGGLLGMLGRIRPFGEESRPDPEICHLLRPPTPRRSEAALGLRWCGRGERAQVDKNFPVQHQFPLQRCPVNTVTWTDRLVATGYERWMRNRCRPGTTSMRRAARVRWQW